MAELVDALVSGTSVLLDVQVRVLFRAQIRESDWLSFFYMFQSVVSSYCSLPALTGSLFSSPGFFVFNV